MGCLSTCRENITHTAEEAVDKLYNSKYNVAFIIGTNRAKIEVEINKVYAEIKRRNELIGEVDKQMLPTMPYFWDDIDGCLAVHCAEISMRPHEQQSKCIALFTDYNYDVLTDPSNRGTPSTTAMASLAMLGSMVMGKGI